MSTHVCLTGLLLAIALAPVTTRAATPAEEEAAFTAAVRKAFESRKAGDLSDLTCWDGTPDKAKRSAEKVYELLLAEKDVTFTVTLEPLDQKAFDKERVQDGERVRWNLTPTRQIALRMSDNNKRILGILTFAVGEKDGKLRLSALTPVK